MTGLWLRPAFIVGLFLTSLLLVAHLHNVQGEREELEGVPEELPEECRSYIKKVLKEHGTGSIEHTSLESEADGTDDKRLDDLQQQASLNEQGDGLSSENKVEDGAKADPSREQSVEVNVQKAEDKLSVHAEDLSDDAPISDKTAKNDAEVEDSKGHGESASVEGRISTEKLESRESIQVSKEDLHIAEKLPIGMTKKLRYNKWTKVDELIDDANQVAFEKEKTKPERRGRYGKWTKSEEFDDTSVDQNVSVEKESMEGHKSEENVSNESEEKLSKETKASIEKTTKESKEKKPVKKGKYGKWTKWEELENESEEEHAGGVKNEEKKEEVKAGKRGKYGKWTKWEDLEDKSEVAEAATPKPKETVMAQSGDEKILETGKEGQRGRYGKWTKWQDFDGEPEEAFVATVATVTTKTITKKEEPIRTGRYGKWTKFEDLEGESEQGETLDTIKLATKNEKSDRKGRYGKWTKWEDFENEEEAYAPAGHIQEIIIKSSSSDESVRKGRYGKWTKWEDFENEEEAMAPVMQDKKSTVQMSTSGEPERRGRYGKWTKWEDFENEEDAYAPAFNVEKTTVTTGASQTDKPERRGRYGKWTKFDDFENEEEAYIPTVNQKKKITLAASAAVKTNQQTDEPERRGKYGKWTKWEDFENEEEAYGYTENIEKKMTVTASMPVKTSEPGDRGRRPRYGKWTKFEEFENEEEAYLSAEKLHQPTVSSVKHDESVKKGRYGKWTKWEDFGGESDESLMTTESPKVVENQEPIDRKLRPYGKWTVLEKQEDLERMRPEEKKEDITEKEQVEEQVRKSKYGKWTKLETSEESKETIDAEKAEPKQIEKREVSEKLKDVRVEKAESADTSMPPNSKEIVASVVDKSETSKSVEYITFEKVRTTTDTEEVESIETLEIESEEKGSIEKAMSAERQKSAERSVQVRRSTEKSAESQRSVERSAEAERSVERYVEGERSAEKSAEFEKRAEETRFDQVEVSVEKDEEKLLYDSDRSAELVGDVESQKRTKSAERIESKKTMLSAEKLDMRIIEVVVNETEPMSKVIIEKKEKPELHVIDDKTVKLEEKKEKKRHEEMSAETKEYKEGQETPEEELIRGVELPENLRSRDHINKLLKLDEENEIKERALENVANVILKDLKKLYDEAIKPLETLYKYRDLSNRHFGDPEIFSKPLVLFMGPWSGGKSSIINYLLNIEYNDNALRTGAEPSPAYFNILMHGDHTEVLDGTQLAADWTFSGLQKFGQGMLDRLRGLKLKSKLLEKVNIVEIPGILEIRKQVQRLFPFNDACQWFIDRADIIFLVYDPSKLDVGPETEAILDQLKGREYQSRIILNKADQVKPEELMRVQGTLIWNISPLMSSVEPPIMYSTSLWSMPYEAGAPIRLLQAQERALLRDLRSAITKKVEHKIASARRFAVRVRNHAKMVDCYLTTYYNHKSFFGNKKDVSDKIIENPQNYHIYEGLSTLTNISRYDLPDPDVYRDFFRLNTLYDFPLLSTTCTYFRGCPINRLDVAIAYDLPELVGQYKKLAETTLRKYDPNYSAS